MFRDLLCRVRNGENEAIRHFLDEFGSDLRRLLRLLLTDPTIRQVYSASDLAQSIFFKFYRQLQKGRYRFDEPAQVVRYLRVVARNKVCKLISSETAKKRDCHKRCPDGDKHLQELAGSDITPLEVIAKRDLLDKFLRHFPAELRSIVVQWSEGKTWRELAEQQRETDEALRKRVSRAIEEVTALLQPENREP